MMVYVGSDMSACWYWYWQWLTVTAMGVVKYYVGCRPAINVALPGVWHLWLDLVGLMFNIVTSNLRRGSTTTTVQSQIDFADLYFLLR